jgi:hypothetical protein
MRASWRRSASHKITTGLTPFNGEQFPKVPSQLREALLQSVPAARSGSESAGAGEAAESTDRQTKVGE